MNHIVLHASIKRVEEVPNDCVISSFVIYTLGVTASVKNFWMQKVLNYPTFCKSITRNVSLHYFPQNNGAAENWIKSIIVYKHKKIIYVNECEFNL